METPGKHMRNVGHEVDQDVRTRYEHYSAEHEMDDSGDMGFSQEVGAMTPLANDLGATDEESTPNEHFPLASSTPEPEGQSDRHKVRNTTIRYATPSNTSLSLEGYFASHAYRASPSSRRALGNHTSNPSSSGSLHALSEHEGIDVIHTPIRRAMSTKSASGHGHVRSSSRSKIGSSSQPASKRPSYSDQLVYPDQSLASLQAPSTNVRPHPVLRTRSSHPAQNLLYNEMAKTNRNPFTSGIRTADNTPMSSPGLFSPTSMKQPSLSDSRLGTSSLHHLQAPKETHTAEIEHDVYSGNKFINNYEVVGELGRGEHGKVKLGRDVERNSNYVAIKIVPRYSVKRRLGKLGTPEDITKREVAILKKARHPNVVSLLEVIDDPNKHKVYLILEYVEKGEIKWRKHGIKEILAINHQRFEQEKLGVNLGIEPNDRDTYIVHLAQARHDRLEQMRKQNQVLSHVPNWSLEYADETEDDIEYLDSARSMTRQWSHISSPSRGNSQDDYSSPTSEFPLSGSMYGSYMPEAYRHRKFSIATSAISHMSSEMNFDLDDDQRSYVPALTLLEARRAFQDTLLGLEFLHYIGIIHRDIKPANLLVSGSGAVKISDFGVSYLGRPITEEEVENRINESEAAPLDDEKELARSVGTPAFWAPELCYESTDMFSDKKEPKITGALDLWALGITLYCMIYARLPFYHNEHMGIHEAICTADVVCPKTRLVPVDTTNSEPVSRISHPINSNKRLDYELKFEVVPDALRDLITKLLIKDPAHRITIADAKKHPWVTEDMGDPKHFLQNPEVAKENKKKILEISDKEIDRAVVKLNFIEKISNTAGKIMGSLLGRKDTRKRASTTASSAGSSTDSLHSPANSSTSTVGKGDKVREARRASLQGDQLLQALKSSRDPNEHHPLAQSQTASPDGSSPEPPSSGYFDHHMKAASTGATPGADTDRQSRPRGPDRAVSALSTADSVKTIRASNQYRGQFPDPLSQTDIHFGESSLRSRVEGLWEGTTKTFTRLASRDRRNTTTRSRSRSRPPSEHDGHADPSLAVSNTYATGAFQTPDALRTTETKREEASPMSPTHASDARHRSPLRVPSSDHVAFEQAQHINHRRQVQEALSGVDNTTPTTTTAPDVETTNTTITATDPCPSSPDDSTLVDQSAPPSTKISPSEMPFSSIPTAISASTIASSIDGYGNSSVSQSISNPSIGVISGSSSPPGDSFLLDEYKSSHSNPHAHSSENEPEFMRTADTVIVHGRPKTPTAVGKALQDEHEYYDDDGDGNESDSSDEDCIVMGGPKKF